MFDYNRLRLLYLIDFIDLLITDLLSFMYWIMGLLIKIDWLNIFGFAYYLLIDYGWIMLIMNWLIDYAGLACYVLTDMRYFFLITKWLNYFIRFVLLCIDWLRMDWLIMNWLIDWLTSWKIFQFSHFSKSLYCTAHPHTAFNFVIGNQWRNLSRFKTYCSPGIYQDLRHTAIQESIKI